MDADIGTPQVGGPGAISVFHGDGYQGDRATECPSILWNRSNESTD